MFMLCTGCPKKKGDVGSRAILGLKRPKIKKKQENRPPLKLNFTY